VGNSNELVNWTNYMRYVANYATNVHEVRLTFRWPYLPNVDVGPNRQAYRITVLAPITNDPGNSPYYFFQPHTFLRGA